MLSWRESLLNIENKVASPRKVVWLSLFLCLLNSIVFNRIKRRLNRIKASELMVQILILITTTTTTPSWVGKVDGPLLLSSTLHTLTESHNRTERLAFL